MKVAKDKIMNMTKPSQFFQYEMSSISDQIFFIPIIRKGESSEGKYFARGRS